MAETVCIIDPIHGAGVARISAAHDVIGPEGWEQDERLGETTAIVIRTTEIGAALFDRLPKLRLIVKHGAGVDNIDIPAATARGVWVANTPGGENSTAVAEGAAALMLAVLRRVREMDARVILPARGSAWSGSGGSRAMSRGSAARASAARLPPTIRSWPTRTCVPPGSSRPALRT